MRSAIIGSFFANDPDQRREFVRAATRITHTDPRAEIAALAIAEAAAWAIIGGGKAEEFLLRLPDCGQNEEWSNICRRLSEAYAANESVADFCRSLGIERGVSGYAFTPFLLHFTAGCGTLTTSRWHSHKLLIVAETRTPWEPSLVHWLAPVPERTTFRMNGWTTFGNGRAHCR